jgi:hypothetical protein
MDHTVVVALNWPKLRDDLSRERGEDVSDRELRAWLEAAGFRHVGGRWRVAETDLHHVDPSEVISIDDDEFLFPIDK